MAEGSGGGGEWWWWAVASSAQAAAGIASYRRGCGESGVAMPFKAFAIATLIVGAGATAVAGALQATGVHSVADMKQVGMEVRRLIRAPPRKTN